MLIAASPSAFIRTLHDRQWHWACVLRVWHRSACSARGQGPVQYSVRQQAARPERSSVRPRNFLPGSDHDCRGVAGYLRRLNAICRGLRCSCNLTPFPDFHHKLIQATGSRTVEILSFAGELGSMPGSRETVIGSNPLVQATPMRTNHMECEGFLRRIDQPILAGDMTPG